jgi:subtilase family serine protease
MIMKDRTGILGRAGSARSILAWFGCLLLTAPAMAGGMKTLPGHVPAVVANLSPVGTLPATNRLNLAIGLPLHNQAALENLLNRLYDPRSPDYRHYLTKEQFAGQFGPTPVDYQAVADFARQNHLTVSATPDNRLLLDVNGTVADIQRAFHVTLRTYHHPTEGREFYAPDTDPSVDTNLPVADISGLSNYGPPHPRSLNVRPALAGEATPRSGSGSGGTYLGKDFRAAYLPGVTLTGTGQMVGLLEFDGYYANDIAAYESTAGLPAVPLQNVSVGGAGSGVSSTGGNTEVSLDIEMAVAMAPGLAKIVVFEAGPSGNPNDILNTMAENTQISQFSSSWGWGGGPTTTTDNIFRQMIAQGQSYFNAAGDSDAFTVGASSIHGADNTSLDNTPSSSPYVTEVGGTTLTTTGPGGAWSSEKVWNWGDDNGSYVGTCGGVSSFYAIPTWQANVSMAANGGSTTCRNIPDVALTADNIYVAYGNGSTTTVGGTSCATPLWAALTALMNEQALTAGRSAVGFINPALYALGASSGYGASFHDITTGNNEWPSSPGSYSAVTGYDLCTGWGTPAGQSLINAFAGVTEPLVLAPATGFTSTGFVGGPFSVNSAIFTLTNLEAGSLSWTVGNLPAWLTVTPASGTLAPAGMAAVTVSLNATASSLPAGNYASSISITDGLSGVSQNFAFALQISEALAIGPATGLTANGAVGGPFSPSSIIYTMTNMGTSSLNWSASNYPSWLTVTPASGTLASHSATAVTAGFNTAANTLAAATYTNSLSFFDALGQTSQTRPVMLQVGQPPSIVQNGGFETGTFSGWTLMGNGVVGNNVYNAVEPSSSYPSVVHSGSYGAFLGDVKLATLSQTLVTVAGQSYQVSFWFDNPSSGSGQQFLVNWNGGEVYYTTNPPASGWTQLTGTLTATSTRTVLQFGAENVPNYFGFDDVVVTPIPNPAFASFARQGNVMSLAFYTVPGASYQLEYCTNLAQPRWIPLSTNLAAGFTTTVTDNPGTDPMRFYRIQLGAGE